MPIIIDGHNLLRSIQESSLDVESIDQVRLCHIIGRYLRLTGDKGQIIFDGAEPAESARMSGIGDLEVLFSGPNRDADTLIETKIAASTAPSRLTVVSSDRRLRTAARVRKADAVKSLDFWVSLRRRLNQPRSRTEPPAKHTGLTDGETDQWLEFFGFGP